MNSTWIAVAIAFVLGAALFAVLDYNAPREKSQPYASASAYQQQSRQEQNARSPLQEIFQSTSQAITETQGQNRPSVWNEGCKGKGTVEFSFPPRKIGDIGIIEPMGLMLSSHVTPIDHQYYYPSIWTQELSEESMKDVFSPADGVVTELQSMPAYFNQGKGTQYGDYRFIIHFTCEFYAIYIHVNQLSDNLKNAIGENERLTAPVEVKAGEYIGRARSFDFSVHYEKSFLKGFVVPEHYAREPWKIHTVDPFDYFSPEVKTQLLTKNIRTEKPLGGKIDRDVDGKLAGSWFEENTNGYQGVKEPEYWVTHASFSPDVLDESHFIISLGDFAGEAKQFGAKGNSPDPKSVGVESGLVKYELVDFDYKDETGAYWNRMNYAKGLKAANSDEVKGTVLVQLLQARKLKLEIFPGKNASEVSGFTGSAKIYER